MELLGVGWVSGEGEQLRAAKTMRDVDRAAGEAIEPLRIVGLDLDINLTDRGAVAPVAIERGKMDGTTVIPSVDAVWAAARRGLLRIGEPVGRQGQQRQQLTVRPRQTQA